MQTNLSYCSSLKQIGNLEDTLFIKEIRKADTIFMITYRTLQHLVIENRKG